MRRRNYSKTQGVRSNRYSGSKLTNWREFEPAYTAIEQAFDRYWDEIHDSHELFILKEATHPKFIMPVSEADVGNWITKLPEVFTKDLMAVLLLSGNNKIAKTFFSRLFCYGCYWLDCIFIIPFPRENMRLRLVKPKPHQVNEYKRVGATVEKGDREGVLINWTEENLRQFYIRDVVIHEVGHHFDRHNNKSLAKKEGFAEWFATEFGIKRRKFESDF